MWVIKRRMTFVLVGIMICALFFQLTSYGEMNKGPVEERLKNAVVVYVNSNFALVNNEERKLDADDNITPMIKNSRTLVPIRFIAESFGGEVSWDQESSKASIVAQNKTIEIISGSKKMMVNNNEYQLDVPALLANDRIYVPLRAVSEALGKEIFYDRGLIIISNIKDIFDSDGEKNLLDTLISKVNKLPNVGSKEKLKSILQEMQGSPSDTMRKTMNLQAMESADSVAESERSSTGYSETNVQVQGVDEADVVKTDGSYIYQVSGESVVISEAYPAEALKVIKTITFDEASFMPQELYVDQEHLVVIGSFHENFVDNSNMKTSIYPYYPMNKVKAYIYDISDKKQINKEREVELEGNYKSSRKIGNILYMVANYGIHYHIMDENDEPLVPSYKDSMMGDDTVRVAYEDIKYIPPVIQPSYLVVGALDLSSTESMHVETYLGTSDDIYMSENNLYITINTFNMGDFRMPEEDRIWDSHEQKSLIYKFSMDDTNITYLAKGEVPGRILNQFSMDEHQDAFRIATTTDIWGNNQRTTSNNVYVLDESLNITGQLEDIAPGERIYSARFMGDRAYMVTFETVDPLFVLDLEDPWKPEILGALKIPGFSNYLHPYDENHLIGFGKDTVELPVKDHNGNEVGTNTYEVGMKIALFDVRDVSHPIEKFHIKIGDRGTDSELLRNHKALLFDKKRDLLAFPITIREVKGSLVDNRTGFPQYGETTFQGAHVYKLTLDEGFELKGTMSHLTDEDDLKSGYYEVDGRKEVKRILYIEDVLYGISDNTISAFDINSIDEINRIDIK